MEIEIVLQTSSERAEQLTATTTHRSSVRVEQLNT